MFVLRESRDDPGLGERYWNPAIDAVDTANTIDSVAKVEYTCRIEDLREFVFEKMKCGGVFFPEKERPGGEWVRWHFPTMAIA